MPNQKIHLLPKTSPGKWSLGMVVVMFLLLFAVGPFFANRVYKGVAAGETIPVDFITRPGLAISMSAGFAAGLAGMVIGLLAMIRHKERAMLVFVSTLVGLLLVVFLAGEFAGPH